MLYALSTSQLMDRPELWHAVHSLRHHIFVDEMGWEDLRRPDELEIDQFDHDEAVHHLVMRNGELAGYQRMPPTRAEEAAALDSLRGAILEEPW
jgi:acyl-homoserine lactone synthase